MPGSCNTLVESVAQWGRDKGLNDAKAQGGK